MAEGTWVAGSILAKLKLDTTQFEKGAGAAAKGTGAMAKEATKAHSAFSGLWKQMAVGIGATALVSKGIGFVKSQISDTMKVGREFEKQWANATTQMNLSAGAMDSMKRELLSLSPTLGSATDLAHGMYEVISAGIPAGKAIKFLGESAKAAKAGFTDSFTAIDALTTVINAYGLSAEDATRISDMMFESVKRGKQTYEEMAGALGTVVPIASQVGMGFDQVAAAMATLTRQGIDANTATVQLRQILVSVLNPSKEAEKMAAALGLEFNAQALAAKGLSGFLADVKEKTGGNVEAMTALFGNVRALTGVMALGGAQAAAFAGDLQAIRDSAGQTELAFQKQMKTLDFWLDTAKNTLEKLKISFYEGFSGPIKEGITTSKELETRIRILQERFEDFGRRIGKAFKFVMDNAESFWAALRGPTAWSKVMAERISGVSGMKEEMLKARIAAEDWSAGLTNLNISQKELLDNFGMNTKEGAKWRAEMERLNEELEGQKNHYDSLNGVMIAGARHMTDQVSAILETSKSSEEASRRIRELRDFMKSGGEAARGGAGALGELDEATKKYKERLAELLDSLGISAEKNRELIDTDRILHALYESGKISLEKFTAAHKELVGQMFEYGEIVPTSTAKTRELTTNIFELSNMSDSMARQFAKTKEATLDWSSVLDQAKASLDDLSYGIETDEDRLKFFASQLGIATNELLAFYYEAKRLAVFLQTGVALPELDFGVYVPDAEEATEKIGSLVQEVSTVFSDAMRNIGRSIIEMFGVGRLLAYEAKEFNDEYFQKALGDVKTESDTKLAAIDAEYEAHKQAILANVADEGARADALADLDEQRRLQIEQLDNWRSAEEDRIQGDLDKKKDEFAKREEERQNSLWTKVKEIVGVAADELLGIMMTRFLSKLADKVFDVFSDTMGNAAKSAVGAVTDITKGASGAISGMWTGLGAAVGSFLGTALAGLIGGGPSGHQQEQMINDIKDTRNFAADIKAAIDWVNKSLDLIKWERVNAVLGKLDNVKKSVDAAAKPMIGYLKSISSQMGEIGGAQYGAILREPGLVMTHGTPAQPEWIIPESRMRAMEAGGPRQVSILNTVNMGGLIITDREYMRTRLMPEFLAALNSNEFKNQAQRALGLA